MDSRLHAYITVCRDEALTEARQAEKVLAGGGEPGPLFGVPVAVKDQFRTKGILTTNGSRVYKDFVPDEDATVITNIKRAGAILLGKLNLSELAMGGTQNPPWGIPRNPWDLERTPGESSSGSGVALAAHLCAASVGEDTGGSGRNPGSYCSAVGPASDLYQGQPVRDDAHVLVHGRRRPHDQDGGGLRPGAGCHRRIRPQGPLHQPETRARLHGPFARRRPRTPHRGYPRAARAQRPAPRGEGSDRRRPGGVPASLARRSGRCPSPSSPLRGPYSWESPTPRGPAHGTTSCATSPWTWTRPPGPRLQSAALVPNKVYNRAMKARSLLRKQMLEALRGVDVLVSANSPYPPPKHAALTAPFASADEVRTRFFFRRSYTGCYALAAMPAASIPCGFSCDRLPIGMQIGARPFGEETLLRAAYSYEQATPWHTMRAPEA